MKSISFLAFAIAITSVTTVAQTSGAKTRIAECKLSQRMLNKATRVDMQAKQASEDDVVVSDSQMVANTQSDTPSTEGEATGNGKAASKPVDPSVIAAQQKLDKLYEQKSSMANSERLSIQEVGLRPETVKKTHNFFELKPKPARSPRIYVDPSTGIINFKVEKGLLKDNILALLNETREAKAENLHWAIAPHKEKAEYWITGRSMVEIAQALVGHHKTPEPVKIGLFINGVIAVYYESNKEFAQ